MRIGLLLSAASRLGSGVAEVVLMHARMMRDAGGFEPVVFTLQDIHMEADRDRWDGIPLTALPVVGPEFLGYAPRLVKALRDADLDLLHLHGLWKYPSSAASTWAKQTGRPHVISPHGMLDPWILGRNSWKKTIARAAYERANWTRAALFHALTEAEAGDIRRSAPGAAVEVVPNAIPGIETATHDAEGRADVLFLGRIHPKKNIAALVDAWVASRGSLADSPARLVIAGWGEDKHVKELEAKLAEVRDPSVVFVGPKYGAEKAELIGTARFLALPSLSEGLPMAVLEAWAAGTPCLMSAGCNLPEGFQVGAALDTGMEIETIRTSLIRGMTMSAAEWSAMSRAATALVGRRFSRDHVAQRWCDIYSMLQDRGGKRPAATPRRPSMSRTSRVRR